ncbi:unnamed protein product [Cyclocybe aegerita]|uniref:Uncharacterized protein n=1 Tax=Cyclocybe aegerita TaxID=1973307 RepID=A0A8S0X4A6_CYCAE|nr:unnamed protein product [Cyclocybe aegerita]
MFPQEILDLFIDELQHTSTNGPQRTEALRAWTLTSRGCCARAQRHLFSKIILDGSKREYLTSVNNLRQILEEDKRITTYAKCLHIINIVDGTADGVRALCFVLGTMPKLHEIAIVTRSLQDPPSWQGCQPEIKQALWNLRLVSPHLTTLTIEGLHDLDCRFFLSWKSISRITLISCTFGNHLAIIPLTLEPEDLVSQCQTLTLTSKSIFLCHHLVTEHLKYSSLPVLPRLTTMSVEVESPMLVIVAWTCLFDSIRGAPLRRLALTNTLRSLQAQPAYWFTLEHLPKLRSLEISELLTGHRTCSGILKTISNFFSSPCKPSGITSIAIDLTWPGSVDNVQGGADTLKMDIISPQLGWSELDNTLTSSTYPNLTSVRIHSYFLKRAECTTTHIRLIDTQDQKRATLLPLTNSSNSIELQFKYCG